MKKILITGFDPFGGESTNPSHMAVMALPDTIGDAHIIKLQLPTIFGQSKDVLLSAIKKEAPQAVILVGQAGGRAAITLERVAINVEESTLADNAGVAPATRPIVADGPAAYFSTLPIHQLVDILRENQIPAGISNTAGTFVCNHVMYWALHQATAEGLPIQAGFIHVPYIPKQVADKPGQPSMALDTIVQGLTLIAGAL